MQTTKSIRPVSSQPLVTAGLMVAAGLILPYITAHGYGIAGNILLPMHIPVLLCGLLCGPWYGAASGVVIPVLSSLLTAMPPLMPTLPMMVAQLLVMGLVSGLLYERFRLNLVLSIAGAIALGLVAYAGAFRLLVLSGAKNMGGFSIFATALRSLPGIAIQLGLLPILVKRLQADRHAAGHGAKLKSAALEEAKGIIQRGEYTCIVLQGEQIIYQAEGRGVSPLMRLYESEPAKLKNAVVADKIIGKAAAMLLVLGGARYVYGATMSAAGLAYLQKHGIRAEYGRCVDVISNRTRTGICPIERSVLEIDDPRKGLEHMKAAIAKLMRQAG